MQPFLFVVGAERSGTTLLRTMLDGHSDLAVVYEPHVVTELDSSGVRRDDGTLDRAAFAKAFIEHRWFRRWELEPADVRAALELARPLFFAEAIRCMYACYADRRGKSRYADKTPAYVFRTLHIAEQFPEARFVHILRDGRDAAASLAAAPFGPDTFEAAVATWRDWLEAALYAGTRLGPGRYLQVRYEDLVTSPRRALERACRFIGLAFEPGMLAFQERASDVLRHERPHYHDRLRESLRADVRDWRRDLTAAQQSAFDRLAGDLNGRLGYPQTAEAPA